MSGNAMRLKEKIRILSRKKDMSAQVVLQNYMFERFLERLSNSTYKDKFILKGGMLIAALVGIANRATMDMDVTIKNYSLAYESLTKAISEICDIVVHDDVTFSLSKIEAIRDGDAYGGYRVSIISVYDTIITPMHIDITTGDEITPKEVKFKYNMLFDEGNIDVWAYNVESVLAEKVETILRRGELNTRQRDFYDVYIITKILSFEPSTFVNALRATAEHRKTTHIFININNRVDEISGSETLKKRWTKYSKDYSYAADITYMDIMNAIRNLCKNF